MPPAKRSTSRVNERSVRQRPASSNARAMAKATAKPQDAPSEPAPVCATGVRHHLASQGCLLPDPGVIGERQHPRAPRAPRDACAAALALRPRHSGPPPTRCT